jgi:4-amino-4-deoxy-L-arabinose transferase-like glycosyltransferase
MQRFSLSAQLRRNLWAMLALLLVARLISLALLPLTDNTEARYGEIARKMLETANWVTPWYDYGVPFWGKPPLSTWLSAASMGVFGINAFAARLPCLLLGVGVLWMVWRLGARHHNRDFSLLSIVLLSSLPLFFVTSGAVMTDASLAFSTCLSFTAFWLAMVEADSRSQHLWGYLFFVGLALGLLAKGPVCGVLTLFPVFLWTWSRGNHWRLLWERLPWVKGALLMLGIAMPWYFLAEHRTPGFIDYFIVGENIKRFLVSGWKGDIYGSAHSRPLGTIWLYWLVLVLPWSLIAITWLVRRFRSLKALFQDQDGWASYLLWWAIWPMLFFTIAHNILWTYSLTGLPAFALLVAEMWHRSSQRQAPDTGLPYRHRLWFLFSVPTLLALTASLWMVSTPPKIKELTQKYLAQKYLSLRSSADSQLYYLFTRYYSAEFYTGGLAHHTDDLDEVRKLLTNNSLDFIAVKAREAGRIPDDISRRFRRVETIGNVLLLEEKNSGLN